MYNSRMFWILNNQLDNPYQAMAIAKNYADQEYNYSRQEQPQNRNQVNNDDQIKSLVSNEKGPRQATPTENKVQKQKQEPKNDESEKQKDTLQQKDEEKKVKGKKIQKKIQKKTTKPKK